MQTSRLSEIWQQATGECPRHGIGCPSTEELAAALHGVDLGERSSSVLDAVAVCARCATIAQLAAGLQPVVVEPVATWRRRLPMFAKAASVLLALGLFGAWFLRPSGPQAQLRGDLPDVLPAHGSTLGVAPVEFAWPVPTQAVCRIELRNAQGQLQHKVGGQRGGRYIADPPLALRPGTYLWSAFCAGEMLGPFVFDVQ